MNPIRLFLLAILLLAPLQEVFSQSRFRGAQVGLLPNRTSILDLYYTGANLVRYQIYYPWEGAVNVGCEEYKNNARNYLNHLDSLLDIDIKWVIDIHVPIGGRDPQASNTNAISQDNIFKNEWQQQCLQDLWTEIAGRYKGNTRVLAYDLYNEPLGTIREVNSIMRRLYNAVRAVDKSKVVIVAPRHHSAKYFDKLPFYKDKNVWYSLHFYDPGVFTHNFSGVKKWGGDREQLLKFLAPVIEFKKKYPSATIYVGEFGASIYTDPDSRFRWFRATIGLWNDLGYHWTLHAWREWIGWSVEQDERILNLFRNQWRRR